MYTHSNVTNPSRRGALFTGLAALLAPLGGLQAAPARPLVEIWKAPGCGCCEDWMKHLDSHGLRAVMHDGGNAAMRAQLGLDARYASCHTARVDGYAVEGHVPAREILRLVRQRPPAIGLAVPGMPIGSPGMDGPAYRVRRDPFDVLLIDKSGRPTVYQHYA